MHSARRLALLIGLVSLVACFTLASAIRAEDKPKPLVIPLQPFGLPKNFFTVGRSLTCFHMHLAGTRLFWLDSSHIFVAFTTNSPCTFKASSEGPAKLRALIFDRTGAKLASRDWPVENNFTLFAGPDNLIVMWKGSRLEFLDEQLRTVESGELDEPPKGLYVTPARRTIPLLTADGRFFEFYGVNPLKLLTTIALDQTTEINTVEEWTPGDERVAGSRCTDKSDFSCTKIFVLASDANFIHPDGAPWSYEEANKVSLHPVGFLDATHLLISRQDKNFFHSPQVFLVRPDGSKTLIPSPGGPFNIRGIAGIADGGSRFGLEYMAEGLCEDCPGERRFVVDEVDSKKFLFERYGTPYFSRFELSPDGKSVAVFDDDALFIYPLPARN
jgi:hypothetical protein